MSGDTIRVVVDTRSLEGSIDLIAPEAAEFASRNVELSEPLTDTDDGLRGFEVADADGYVLFFGRPR